jgi:hypothetical protein
MGDHLCVTHDHAESVITIAKRVITFPKWLTHFSLAVVFRTFAMTGGNL